MKYKNKNYENHCAIWLARATFNSISFIPCRDFPSTIKMNEIATLANSANQLDKEKNSLLSFAILF